jgi:hypothetical protein
MSSYLVLPRLQEKSAQHRNEISTFRRELVLRDIPGKSVERPADPERLRGAAALRVPLADPTRAEVVRIAGAPVSLRLRSPLRLALGA